MGIAERQNIPTRTLPREEWSIRRLLGGGITAISTAFTKVFVSPFEWLLTFSLFFIAIAELGNRNISPFFYWVGAILLVCVIFRRIFGAIEVLPEDTGDTKEK